MLSHHQLLLLNPAVNRPGLRLGNDAKWDVVNTHRGQFKGVTKRTVSVETVRWCTRDVRSKEDRPIFSVPVARATAHRGGDGVEFPTAVY